MPQRQILVPLEVAPPVEPEYDPAYCKTCQKRGLRYPKLARTLYSDCEEHFRQRVRRLLLTGVYIIQKR